MTNIMLVEDEGLIARDVKSRLERLGHRVVAICSRGQDALEKAGECLPNLILMDIKIKGEWDGIETAQRIQQKYSVPIVFQSAFSDEATIKRAKLTGPFAYLVKPVEDRDLHIAIEVALYKHKLESRLIRRERWFLKTLSCISEAVITTDPKGRINFINPTALRLLGNRNIKGKRTGDIFRIWNDEKSEVQHNPIEEVMQNGQEMSWENQWIELPNETWIPADMSASPMWIRQDQLMGVVLVIRDISQRKRAEAALRRERDKANQYLNIVEVVIVAMTTAGIVTLVNQKGCTVFGLREQDIIGKDFFENFVPRKLAARAKRQFKDYLEERKVIPEQLELPVVDTEGKEKLIVWHQSLYRDENGKVTGLLSSGIDITKMRRLEKQLLHARKMEAIGTLAGGIAHDFNNVLAGIIGYTELAMEEVWEPESAMESLERVLEGGVRARELVKNILSFCRQSEETLKPTRLQPLIAEAFHLLRATLPSTIEIRHEIDPLCGPIQADATQMHQLIMNLATNAFQAMSQEGGILEVRLKEISLDQENLTQLCTLAAGNYLRLSVSDTGLGMEPELIERIFDPFFTTKKVNEGTGLGLSIVHGIIKRHKGDIHIASEPGKGTCFHIYLPLCEKEEDWQEKAREGAQPGNEHVLVIDDEDAIVTMMTKILSRLGYRVTGKNDSTGALNLFKQQPHCFDLVFLDQTMPSITGFELAKQFLAIRPDIPIILATGYSDVVDPNSALGLGIKKFMMKPLRFKEISQTIRTVLEQDQAERVALCS